MLYFFPRNVVDEILDFIGSVSEGFPTYFLVGHVASDKMPDNVDGQENISDFEQRLKKFLTSWNIMSSFSH